MHATRGLTLTRRLLIAMALIFFCGGATAMQIRVEISSGGSILLEVQPSDSIQQVKQKIQDETGIVPQKQQLYFAGVLLEDGRTLADYGVQSGDVLRLVVLLAPVMVPLITHGKLIGLAVLLMLFASPALVRQRY